MADQDQDPFASIATPIAAAPATRQPLRNPRIAGNEPDPFASIATPIATAPAAPKEEPGILDKEIPLTSYGNATLSGLQSIGRGVRDVTTGIGEAVAHPVKSVEAMGNMINALPGQVKQIPAAVKDINASADPLGTYAKVAQETAGQGAAQALISAGAEKLMPGGKPAGEVVPEPISVAGTELPETVGQSAARANPSGIGTDIKGVEDVARRIPGSEKLRAISTAQQDAAREVLANKAASATGAPTSTAPEAIEQNAANAADAAKSAGSAKYQAIGQAAADADFTKPVEAAHNILQDETTMKVLPKGAREALGKVASSMSEREEIAQQIYGKSFSDLEPTKQAEVNKALGTSPVASSGFADVLKARSELGSAANAAKDPADARLLHMAHEEFDQATQGALTEHDKAMGTDHAAALKEADKLWSQKYAFENFRDKLQDIMRDQPHTGNREINGAAFQKLINDLDPRGAKGTTQLQRMFPGDAQSVADLHELADFMGRTQGSAGGMASGFAKLRILGLKESALGLIANNIGFSWLLSKPHMARALLNALSAGKNVAKASAAIGAINHAANFEAADQSLRAPSDTSPTTQPMPTSGQTTAATSSGIPTATTIPNSTTPAANSNPNSITPSVPRGRVPVSVPGTHKLYHFPNQKAADDFKKAAGIQ